MKRVIVLLIFILMSSTLLAENKELGFVALSEGNAKYEHLGDSQKATSSFFLVDLFDEFNIAMGAIIFNSQQSYTERKNETIDGISEYSINVDNVEHRAWGTIVAFSWSSETLAGIQAWSGLGYLSNTLSFEGHNVSLYKYPDSSVDLCEMTMEGGSVETKSVPFFIGLGFTVWGFGVFAQYMEQNTAPIKVKMSVDDRCTAIIEGASYSDQYNETFTTKVKSSFKLVNTGIQYRF